MGASLLGVPTLIKNGSAIEKCYSLLSSATAINSQHKRCLVISSARVNLAVLYAYEMDPIFKLNPDRVGPFIGLSGHGYWCMV